MVSTLCLFFRKERPVLVAREMKREPAVCTLPMVPCGLSPVSRLYLAKNEVPEEEAGLGSCGLAVTQNRTLIQSTNPSCFPFCQTDRSETSEAIKPRENGKTLFDWSNVFNWSYWNEAFHLRIGLNLDYYSAKWDWKRSERATSALQRHHFERGISTSTYAFHLFLAKFPKILA